MPAPRPSTIQESAEPTSTPSHSVTTSAASSGVEIWPAATIVNASVCGGPARHAAQDVARSGAANPACPDHTHSAPCPISLTTRATVSEVLGGAMIGT